MTRDPDELLSLLYTYGEHRWKCEVTRSIRESRRVDTSRGIDGCDCGWQTIARELYGLGVKRL